MNEFREDTIVFCPHCSFAFDSPRQPRPRRTCPNCGDALTDEAPNSWTAVARISNLAEAGFLADELMGRGIEARVHQVDDFNALYDRWTSAYLIQVPTADVERAAIQIQQYRDDDLRRMEADAPAEPATFSNHLMDPLFWRPLALVMLTGIAGFTLGQRLSGDRADRRPRSDSLASAANQVGRPFVTEPVAGKARYRLSFDSRQQAWSLDTDRDNDGHYDSRQQFHPSGSAW